MSKLIALPASPLIVAAKAGRRVRIEAYSGGLMHPVSWPNLVIDLAGLTFNKNVVLLAAHDHAMCGIVGYGTPKSVNGAVIVEGTIANSPAADAVWGLLEVGVPLQASVGCETMSLERVAPNATTTINGRSLTAGESGMTIARTAVLKEVSIVALGADPNTSVSIAARLAAGARKMDMAGVLTSFESWLESIGFDPSTLEDSLGSQVFEPGNQPASDQARRMAGLQATYAKLKAAESNRIDSIKRICASRPGLRTVDGTQVIEAAAIQGGWDANRTELEMIRAGRPNTVSSISGQSGRGETTPNHLAASILLRTNEKVAVKAFGADVCQQARAMRLNSLVDVATAAVRMSGRDVPNGSDQVIRAAFSTVTLPQAMSNAANKVLEHAYNYAPPTWSKWAGVRNASNFKTQTSIRGTAIGQLEQVGQDGEIKHGSFAESAYTWSLSTFAKMFAVTRQTLINDDLSIFDELMPAWGRAADRAVADLVYKTLLANAGSFFSSGNKNYISGGDTALSASSLAAALLKLRTQKDADGNTLGIAPAVLLVSPENEVNALQIINSATMWRTGDNVPDGNALVNLAEVVVEPRLSNSSFSGSSATQWYLMGGPSDAVAVVGFLDNKASPTIETEDAPFDTLGTRWRVYFDFGAALADPRCGVKSAGA